MKNLKKLNRENLKNVKGGAGNFCTYCKTDQACGSDCYGNAICVPKGEYIAPNC